MGLLANQDCPSLASVVSELFLGAARLTPKHFASEIAVRRSLIPEFQFIKEEAEKRGLRVWLFGGTASGYAHYVKWDVLRELGDLRFQADRFDYDYTNIFRSTQDLDIVVDGSAAQAEEFEQALKAQFPYFLGSKANAWEVRSIKEPRGDKGALLGDHNFMNQHTDSNSTGMIELTEPKPGDSVVRDMRDWENKKNPKFFEDVLNGEIHFYYSSTHQTTERFGAGKNPPIFAAIRALTKAFQYDLKIRPEDLEILKTIVRDFDPGRDLATSDAKYWIEKNGKKLFQHAVNLEYAANLLDELGLRKKLISIKNNPTESGSLAFWMSKAPLTSKPVGLGSGRTAKELGITEVAHETRDFLAYESITRAHTGEPNVFKSRRGASGESAAHGDGFYSAIGKKGAKGTGITIRFKVSPNAREGEDFILGQAVKRNGKVEPGHHVIWTNRQAIEVIPESLNMTPMEYFEFLAKGETISADDQALLWKLKRKLDNTVMSGRIAAQDLQKIREMVLESVQTESPNRAVLLQEWIAWEGARLKKAVDVGFADALRTMEDRIDLEPVTSLEKMFRGTDLEAWMNDKMLPLFLEDLGVEGKGERALAVSLLSTNPALLEFGEKLLIHLRKERPTALVNAFEEIVKQKKPSELDLKPAVERWLSSDQGTSEFKAEFVLFQLGAGPQKYSDALSLIPALERPRVLRALEKKSSLSVFEKLAAQRGLTQFFEETARSESMVFVPRPAHRKFGMGDKADIPIELTKAIEIQATPVTQLQWTLVMGENPSYFVQEGKNIRIGRSPLQVDPNRPVEYISWNDAQDFIKKLNEFDPDYTYRLPTEAEWEEAHRAGTTSQYFYGDDGRKLKKHGWHGENSGQKTQPVASLEPNSIGLHDSSGNVWEWVEDLSGNLQKGQDPSGPKKGSFRILRGGGWGSFARFLRSANRRGVGPDDRYSDVGLRLVRTPK
jgi:formylglycine-generating enzyme required for sulfatase activity